MAKWYKERLKTSILNQKYSDQRKVDGIGFISNDVKEKIYEQYLSAFKKGVFDYIKEVHDYLWAFIRVAFPYAGGKLDDWVDHALQELEYKKERR